MSEYKTPVKWIIIKILAFLTFLGITTILSIRWNNSGFKIMEFLGNVILGVLITLVLFKFELRDYLGDFEE